MKLISICTVLLSLPNAVMCLKQNIPKFYGDVNLEQFVLSYRNISEQQKLLYLVDHNIESQLHKYLIQKRISHTHFKFSNISETATILPKKSFYNSEEVLVIFTFETLSKENFNSTFKELSNLYAECLVCKPFLVQLSLNFDFLIQWTSTVIQKLSKSFQLTLIPKNCPIVHVNPILNGCQRHPGLLIPKTQLDFQLLKVPFNKCNFNAQMLNVSINQWQPFCDLDLTTPGVTKFKFSMESELLNVLKKQYNFSVNLIFANDIWGAFVNGTWTGLIGDVYYGKSDIALCGLARTKERLQVVDFTSHIFTDELAFFMQSPGLLSRDWIVSRPFTQFVWISIFASFLLILTAMYFIAGSRESVVMRMFAICLNQSIHDIRAEHRLATRLLYAILMLSTLIFTNSYSSCFYSILTVPEYESTIESLDELEDTARRDSHYILAWEHSTYLSQFIYAEKENRFFYTVGLHINRTKRKMVTNERDQFELADQSPRNIIVSSRLYLNKGHLNSTKNPLHISQENVALYYTAMAVQKRSPLIKPFNIIIERMQEMGLFTYWVTARTEFSYIGDAYALKQEDYIKILAIPDVKSVFILWMLGIGISVLIFFSELATFNFKLSVC